MNMLKTIANRALQAYLFSSTHIALIGSIYVYILSSQMNASFFAFWAIWVVYNLLRIIRIRDFEAIQSDPHLRWVSDHLTEIVLCLGFAWVFMALSWNIFNPAILIAICILTAIYPLVRQHMIPKNVIIGAVWTALPYLWKPQILWSIELPYTLLYITWLSALYDQKDHKISPRYLYTLSSLVLLFSIIYAIMSTKVDLALYICQLLLILFSIFIFDHRREYLTYMFWVDLLIINHLSISCKL